MAPTFPAFKPLKISDKKIIDKHYGETDFYSDFVFSNAWVWDLTNQLEITSLNDNLVFKFTDYESGDSFYSFNSTNQVEHTIDTLLTHATEIGIAGYLNYIPQEVVDCISHPDKYKITPDRGGFDYIYTPADIMNYAGSKYKSKRQAAKKFISEYPNSKIQPVKNIDDKTKFELRKAFQNHQKNKSGTEKSFYLNLEGQSFERTLEIKDHLDIHIHLLLVDDTSIGFSVDEIIDNRSVLSHFIKVNTDFTGAYEYFNQQLAAKLHDIGIEHWNWVEDLDIENLRKSKLSYRPSKILKQYKIELS